MDFTKADKDRPVLVEKDKLTDTPFDAYEDPNWSRFLQRLFVLVCIVVASFFWAPQTVSRLWGTYPVTITIFLATFPVFTFLYGVNPYRRQGRGEKIREEDLTTRQRRLYGLPPDPRSALADRRAAKLAREREEALAQASLSDSTGTNDYFGFKERTYQRSSYETKLRSAWRTPYSSPRKYGNLGGFSPISPERLEVLEDLPPQPPTAAQTSSLNLDDEDFTTPFSFDQRFSQIGRLRVSVSPPLASTSSLTNKSLPRKLTADYMNQFSMKASALLRKLKIAENDVSIWAAKLKRWMVETILKPRIKEFENSDRHFKQIADKFRSGDRYSTLTNSQKTMLNDLDKFRDHLVYRAEPNTDAAKLRKYLDKYLQCDGTSIHKSYVLRRLKSFGGSLSTSDYTGLRGGSDWKPGMPTDAKIVMHAFLTWIEDAIPAFRQYCFVKNGVQKRARNKFPAIRECYLNPPYYCITKASSDKDLQFVTPGRENVFCCIVMFLYMVKKNHGSRIVTTDLTNGSLRGLSYVISSANSYY
eukprot:jgi/Bigna1/127490/aug1.4_g2198